MTPQPWTELITIETMMSLYQEGITRYGGKPSDPKLGCLEGSAGNAYNAGFYNAKNDPPTPLEISLVFSAYLLFYLAKDHCFIDGNKRIAWTSCMYVLATIGLTLNASQEEAEQFMDGVVTGNVDSGADVALWIERHLVAIN